MKGKLLIYILFAVIILGCGKKTGLERLARENLPSKLAEVTEEYLGSSEGLEITDIQVIYDCDSLCILQCRSCVKDAYGNDAKEEIRYFFALDRFLSSAKGVPSYFHSVQGANYLSDEGIAEFKKKMNDGGHERFILCLAMCDPVR